MALNTTVLSNALYNAFINMGKMAENNVGPEEGNIYAATQIALALDTYLNAATISSVSDVGSYSIPPATIYPYAGISSGFGIGINVNNLANNLAKHFMEDNLSDDKIADYIANDINTAIITSNIEVTTSGVYTIPGTPPTPKKTSADGKGVFTGQPAILSNGLKQLFREMFQQAKNANKNYNGNREFANRLSGYIDEYIKLPGCLTLNYSKLPLICTTSGIIS